jgi:inner membrane protease subunit 1
MSTMWNTLRRAMFSAIGLAGSLAKWGIIVHCTLEYVGNFVICQGPSMEPTIRTSDVLITEHISPRYGWLNRGDIIVTRSPTNPKQFICKRVLAVAGDTLMLYNGTLETIPRGYIWIEGDNEQNSIDSRTYGPIPMGLVRGRALLRIWPFTDIAYLVPNRTEE